MGHVVRVDDEVWDRLNEKARELGMVFASRNVVLRTVLGLPPPKESSGLAKRSRSAKKLAPSPRRTAGGRPATR